jgi:hypothetical protein
MAKSVISGYSRGAFSRAMPACRDSFWRARLTGFVGKPQDRKVAGVCTADSTFGRRRRQAHTARDCTHFLAEILGVSVCGEGAQGESGRRVPKPGRRGIQVALS